MEFVVKDYKEKFIVAKSIDAPKSNQNILAALPKACSEKIQKDQSFKALVLEIEEGLPIIVQKFQLLESKDSIPTSQEQLTNGFGQTFTGVIAETGKNRITVKFLKGMEASVSLRNIPEETKAALEIGQCAKVFVSKAGKLQLSTSLKSKEFSISLGAQTSGVVSQIKNGSLFIQFQQ